ncbi:hypothetical protein PAHAL_2G233200 [Panicum hallii]|uniref:Uncharacterized protein n=1 Tax=Panicum hallii TaxID=206008 RepID=A0A2S3GZ27_9POAL|nr:hypothetical protein PAHAL_2G233200 [Panicum hallii]
MHKQDTIFDMFIRVDSTNHSKSFYMHKEATIVSAFPATAMVTIIRHNHNLDMNYRSTIAWQPAFCFFTMHLSCVRTSLQCIDLVVLSGFWDRPPGFLDLGPSPVCPFDSSILSCGSELRHM